MDGSELTGAVVRLYRAASELSAGLRPARNANVRFRFEQQQLALKCRYERERAQVLLIRKALVNSDEGFEVVPREGEWIPYRVANSYWTQDARHESTSRTCR